MYTITQFMYVYFNDMVVAVAAEKHGVAMGKDAVSGLMFYDDFVGISETCINRERRLIGNGG